MPTNKILAMFTLKASRFSMPILRTLKILQSNSEFGGVSKHQNNPACTKSVSLHNVEAGIYTEEGEEVHLETFLPEPVSITNR